VDEKKEMNLIFAQNFCANTVILCFVKTTVIGKAFSTEEHCESSTVITVLTLFALSCPEYATNKTPFVQKTAALWPCAGSGVVRIDLLCFLAGCCKR